MTKIMARKEFPPDDDDYTMVAPDPLEPTTSSSPPPIVAAAADDNSINNNRSRSRSRTPVVGPRADRSSDAISPTFHDSPEGLAPGRRRSSGRASPFRAVSDDEDDSVGGDASGGGGGGGYIGDGIRYGKSLYRKYTRKTAFIAVMGMTGSGKTTFISKVTGRRDLKIGHDLQSCTQEIQVVETKIGGSPVCFVDTPGFSDTHLSDTEVLEMIANYLAAAFQREVRLSGIIYLHRISDNRFTHHAVRNLDMFRKLTGDNNLKHVILATTMWDRVTAEEGERCEAQLRDKFWRMLISYGAQTARHDGTAETGRGIASRLIANSDTFYVQLQEEMGRGGKALRETEAGRELMLELAKLTAVHQRELAEMREEMIRAAEMKNASAVAALEDMYSAKIRDLEKTLGEERRMNEDNLKTFEERIRNLEAKGDGGGGGGGGGCVIL